MVVQYARLNPTGNMTAIVTSPVPRAEQPRVAARLMARGGAFAEQVAFLEGAALPGARIRLQMMGGEFCGNASMSLAALLALGDGLADGVEATYPLEVSGAEGLVNCRVRREGASFRGTVEMPLPEEILEAELFSGTALPLVRFPGIAHAIVPEAMLEPEAAQARIPALCEELNADAMGLLLTDANFTRMRPLVYVRATNSAVWEHGCGSGTAALGAYAAARSGRDAALAVSQSGGTICVRAVWRQGAVRKIEISGRVTLEETGEAELS